MYDAWEGNRTGQNSGKHLQTDIPTAGKEGRDIMIQGQEVKEIPEEVVFQKQRKENENAV